MTTPLMSHGDHTLRRGLQTRVLTSHLTVCAHNSRRARTTYNRHFSLMYMVCARRVRVRPSRTIEPIQVVATQHDKCVSPTDGDNLALTPRNLAFSTRNLASENVTSLSDSMLARTYDKKARLGGYFCYPLHACGRTYAHPYVRAQVGMGRKLISSNLVTSPPEIFP